MKRCAACGEEKPYADYHKNGKSRDGFGSYCRPCANEISRKWREANPDRKKQEWGPYKRLLKYGITAEEFDAMSAAQGGRCAICGEIPDAPLCLDHDHKTGNNRGLLCLHCNWGIGHLRDDPVRLRAAIRYLEQSSN